MARAALAWSVLGWLTSHKGTNMLSKNPLFRSIASNELSGVSGGASRVSSRSSSSTDQLTMMLTQITSSIKDLATNKSQTDPMQMMMMMMMMMGGGPGGGGGGAPAAAAPPEPPPPAQPVINISTRVGR